ncbi:MAG: helix-turn-helix transcriptional regulator [Streptomycetaceae bacterium]|nr:helix-turn-helix transcriptional regulator [Streptomycetaceae bacterium]
MFAACTDDSPPRVRLGDKWTAKILRCLVDGPRRFSELRVPLRSITPKVLTETLRALERDGIVARTAYPETPPRVEYELTALGRELIGLLDTCCSWNQQHGEQILAARRSYEERVDAEG